MTFDVIITTYNRPVEVLQLARQVLDCDLSPANLIIVDSSDEENKTAQELRRVVYIRSSHKNQPYQRCLGAKAATSDVIIFLDDDLSITRKDIFQLILNAFEESGVVGVSVGFEHHNSTLLQMDTPVWNEQGDLTKLIWQFTGVPTPHTGKIGRLGISGMKPRIRSEVQSFNGAIMAYKKEVFEKTFPKVLLSLYERNLGKGEDKVISMSALQYGRLQYIPEVCLLHPPNDSTYFQNVRSFTAKVAYSRLYLSRIYAQVFHKPWWREVLIYYWFTAWRVLIALLSLLIRPSKGRKDKLLGAIDGLWLSLTLPQKSEKLTPGINWHAEIQKDLTNAKRATSRI